MKNYNWFLFKKVDYVLWNSWSRLKASNTLLDDEVNTDDYDSIYYEYDKYKYLKEFEFYILFPRLYWSDDFSIRNTVTGTYVNINKFKYYEYDWKNLVVKKRTVYKRRLWFKWYLKFLKNINY